MSAAKKSKAAKINMMMKKDKEYLSVMSNDYIFFSFGKSMTCTVIDNI